MIRVKATILPGGPYASLELETVDKVVSYVRERPNVSKWEINGTPEEEDAIARELNWLCRADTKWPK